MFLSQKSHRSHRSQLGATSLEKILRGFHRIVGVVDAKTAEAVFITCAGDVRKMHVALLELRHAADGVLRIFVAVAGSDKRDKRFGKIQTGLAEVLLND